MPGTILGAISKQRIADCHIEAAKYVTDRKGLVAIRRAAKVALGKGTLMDSVDDALTAQARILGVYKERSVKNA